MGTYTSAVAGYAQGHCRRNAYTSASGSRSRRGRPGVPPAEPNGESATSSAAAAALQQPRKAWAVGGTSNETTLHAEDLVAKPAPCAVAGFDHAASAMVAVRHKPRGPSDDCISEQCPSVSAAAPTPLGSTAAEECVRPRPSP